MHFAMRTTLLQLLLAAAMTLASPAALLGGGDGPLAKPVLESDFPFVRGATELQLVVGPFLHIKPTGNPRPRTEFVQAGLRYGWMLSTPGRDGFLRGNFEFLLEGFGAGIYRGPGSFLAGADMMLRYNFVQRGARLIPYLHILGGGLYNDVYKTETQGLLDTPLEWYLGGDLGLRYRMTERLFLSLEVGYRHISNAGTGDRNLGLNSLGTTAGVSWFF